MQEPEPFPMPRHFMARFVIGKMSILIPVFVVILSLSLFANRKAFLVMFAAYATVLLLTAPVIVRSAKRQRRYLEIAGREAADENLRCETPLHWLLILSIAIVIGTVHGLIRGSWFGSIVGLTLGVLMALGNYVGWLIYDRWINNYLLTLPLRSYDAIEVMSWIDPYWWRSPRSPSSSLSRSS